jgi:16S rRNA C967 or C1407 C5-methylase (RsmB/RsmF family)
VHHFAQLKRMASPNLIITNLSADAIPLLRLPPPDYKPGANSGASNDPITPSWSPLRFDRILADVPCSGDGTIRKAPDIWRRWNVSSGIGLHMLQQRIAAHGLQLLRVGGRMVSGDMGEVGWLCGHNTTLCIHD